MVCLIVTHEYRGVVDCGKEFPDLCMWRPKQENSRWGLKIDFWVRTLGAYKGEG